MNKKKDTLRFTYGISRGQNSYGYRIVNLLVNGKKEFSTNGGGYDMRGTVFGQYLTRYYLPRITTLRGNKGSMDDGTGFYGLTFYNTSNEYQKEYKEGYGVYLNGACGMSCMVRIAEAIGLQVEYLEDDILLVTDTK